MRSPECQLLYGYKVTEKLGEGGLAIVYKAHKPEKPKHHVAIKVWKDPIRYPDAVHEASIHGGLVHPNIVPMIEFIPTKLTPPMLIMKCVGNSMDKALKQGQIPTPQALKWITGIADALTYMHKGDTVHRDIKPGNILIGPDALLADFGAARKIHGDDYFKKYGRRTFGTIPYKAPERLLIGRPPTPTTQADIYSLGAVAYEVLTGRKAFPQRDPVKLQSAVILTPPEPFETATRITPGAKMSHVLGALEPVVLRALDKDPDSRPQSAKDFSDELTEAIRRAPKKRRIIDLKRKLKR